MPIRKFAASEANYERSPGQDDEVFTADMIDQRHGGPVTIGFGRYGPNATLTEEMAVDDTMIVLEGRLTVSAGGTSVTGGAGEIINMPKGETVTIKAHENGAVTAYVTYPHWQEAVG